MHEDGQIFLAEAEDHLAKEQEQANRRLLYAAEMSLAGQAWDEGRVQAQGAVTLLVIAGPPQARPGNPSSESQLDARVHQGVYGRLRRAMARA